MQREISIIKVYTFMGIISVIQFIVKCRRFVNVAIHFIILSGCPDEMNHKMLTFNNEPWIIFVNVLIFLKKVIMKVSKVLLQMLHIN